MCKQLFNKLCGRYLRNFIHKVFQHDTYHHKMAVQQDGWSLQWVPEKYLTEDLCKEAVQQNGWSLQWVSEEYITQELCKTAVQQNTYRL